MSRLPLRNHAIVGLQTPVDSAVAHPMSVGEHIPLLGFFERVTSRERYHCATFFANLVAQPTISTGPSRYLTHLPLTSAFATLSLLKSENNRRRISLLMASSFPLRGTRTAPVLVYRITAHTILSTLEMFGRCLLFPKFSIWALDWIGLGEDVGMSDGTSEKQILTNI